ncbi:MAG TPA: peptide deformylase [Anaerolineaceae bacterium]|jgi:peptide deformylase|nr:peptide deformylase [Anaerolineaceae bacterium]
MTTREIITIPDPILRRKAHKITDFGKDFQTLAADMVETLRSAPGVGLAAPQVAVSSRLIVVEFNVDEEDDESPKKLYILANPEIVEASEEMVKGIEGCLSIPDLVGEVERHKSVVVKAQNKLGKPVKIKASGWLARIFQHEIDHLDGILFTDRTEKIWQPREEEVAID